MDMYIYALDLIGDDFLGTCFVDGGSLDKLY